MSKAVLVIDMPVDCVVCQYYDSEDDLCQLKHEYMIDNTEFINGKPDWCPIVELPERRNVPALENVYDWHDNGWNACLDAIEGSGEHE